MRHTKLILMEGLEIDRLQVATLIQSFIIGWVFSEQPIFCALKSSKKSKNLSKASLSSTE